MKNNYVEGLSKRMTDKDCMPRLKDSWSEAAEYLAVDPEILASQINSDLDKICTFLEIFSWCKPKVIFGDKEYSKAYIRKKKIMLGVGMIDKMSVTTEQSILKAIREVLVHELIHFMKGGHGHDKKTRELGFWSAKSRDTLTSKVEGWIFGELADPTGGARDKPPELTKLSKYWNYYYFKDNKKDT